ncbi:uncharacterized protein LOC124595875 [Schistocerca americana]|uniref:uncharacterized protein LOC124595875 n=1 Tax=Schistocerca americana TaxID=7009 RepID=UPI001F4FCB11|nr:uncharacterized protein LOC124595875 [Schistocerca americana]
MTWRHPPVSHKTPPPLAQLQQSLVDSPRNTQSDTMVTVTVAAMLAVLAVAVQPSAAQSGKCDVVRCANPRQEECGPAGGVFIEADRVTRCCDACVKYLGEGEKCGGSLVNIPVPTCRAGLDCDSESSLCVRAAGNA